MTSVEYVQAMEMKASRKEVLEHKNEQQCHEALRTWGKSTEEK